MIHTALSATHMVDISLRDPGGGEMIKVRLQGTKEDMEWLENNYQNVQRSRLQNHLRHSATREQVSITENI